jgi:POT family proton-dependent oligopeptide transporter
VSTVVGDLYPEGARRDAGFSIFYMGINLGALLGPLFCGYVGEKINWHYGFALAGIGMVLGLIQYRAMNRFLGDHGRFPELKSDDPELQRRFVRKGWFWVAVGVGLIGLVYLLTIAGVIHINPVAVAGSSGIAMVAMGVLYFAGVLMFGKLGSMERRHVLVIAILCIGGIAFWAGFEQAGSNFNLFAERYTDRMAFGWQYPASWFQMANPLYILIFAPVFGWFWIALGRRNLNPSMPLKFGIGLALVGVGFLVMVAAAQLVIAKGNVLPTWLLLTYLLHTFGELSLSPVGLSSVTKLAPRRLGGQMMGMWFLATAIGDLAAGLIAGQFHADDVQAMPNIYWELALMLLGLGAIFAVFSRPIQKYLIGPDIE